MSSIASGLINVLSLTGTLNTSKEHLIDFSSSGSSDKLDVLWRENKGELFTFFFQHWCRTFAPSFLFVCWCSYPPRTGCGARRERCPWLGVILLPPSSMWRVMRMRSSRESYFGIWRSTMAAISGMIEKAWVLQRWMSFLLIVILKNGSTFNSSGKYQKYVYRSPRASVGMSTNRALTDVSFLSSQGFRIERLPWYIWACFLAERFGGIRQYEIQ